MTGQPVPGEPSQMMVPQPFSLARARASCLSRDTSLPEFSLPGRSPACTKGPKRVLLMCHVPQSLSWKSMASEGQSFAHTPQPSQARGSMENAPFSSRTASNWQRRRHVPQWAHFSCMTTALGPPTKSSVFCTVGFRMMCMSGTSTSRSQMTAF